MLNPLHSRWLAAMLVIAAAHVMALPRSAVADAGQPVVQRGVPFVMPWDHAGPEVADLSDWSPNPAGRWGHVRVDREGRLTYERRNRERVRFFGVNMTAAAAFPEKRDAPKIAARMASFGINAVRFHHLEAPWSEINIFKGRGAENTRDLDEEALDRLMYFIAELRRHGIYTNMNLLTSRRFRAADGLPEEVEDIDWKLAHVAAMYHPRMIELQKDYARALLTHRNPHTSRTLAEDPAVAMVEIHNENGLIHAWLGGDLDRLPEPLLQPLQQRWNEWLADRYDDRDDLAESWQARKQEPGEAIAINGNFDRGTSRWFLERHEGADARLKRHTPDDEPPYIEVEVQKTGSAFWHVQLTRPGLSVDEGQIYTLSFEASADRHRDMIIELSQAHDPWDAIGLSTGLELKQEWQAYHYTFVVRQNNRNARINFTGLGLEPGTIRLRRVELRPGGAVGMKPDWDPEQGTVPLLRRDGNTPWTAPAEDDFTSFLWEVERDYWQTMQQYLRDQLNVKALLLGTVLGCSTPHVQEGMDAFNAHGYWQHPRFPGRAWDPDEWHVTNQSMVSNQGGPLASMALRRVKDHPFLVTEYNHAAPNTYSSEAPLLAAAYAAYQDWDGLFLFDYASDLDWDAGRIQGFFAIGQHPTKMANLPAAAAMFRRGDVSPAGRTSTVQLSAEKERELIRRYGRAWNVLDASALGMPRYLPLTSATAIELTDGRANRNSPSFAEPPRSSVYATDTDELKWDLARQGKGVVTVDTPRSMAVIGYSSDRRYDLGDVTIRPGRNSQGWSTIALTVLEGGFYGSGRALMVATGKAANTDMKWTSDEQSSVGADWGRKPSRVEVIPARVELPVRARQVRAWALDERGKRKGEMRIDDRGNGRSAIEPGSRYDTIWYEIEWR